MVYMKKSLEKKNTKLLFEIPLLRIGPRQSLSPDCLQMILSLQSWLLHILKGVFFFFAKFIENNIEKLS